MHLCEAHDVQTGSSVCVNSFRGLLPSRAWGGLFMVPCPELSSEREGRPSLRTASRVQCPHRFSVESCNVYCFRPETFVNELLARVRCNIRSVLFVQRQRWRWSAFLRIRLVYTSGQRSARVCPYGVPSGSTGSGFVVGLSSHPDCSVQFSVKKLSSSEKSVGRHSST